MSDLSRFGVSVEDELLKSFDQLIAGQGYTARSEALRDLMRDALVKSRILKCRTFSSRASARRAMSRKESTPRPVIRELLTSA